jgi:hypothetical protein
MWIAEQIAIAAEQERSDETSLRRRLAEVEAQFELGQLTVEEYEAREDELLAQLELLRASPSYEVIEY